MCALLTRWCLIFVVALQAALSNATAPLEVRSSGPSPIVIPASQDFKGDNGPWSTFTLQIGQPPQDVEVLVSTAGYQTIAVLPGGCVKSDPASCPADRGNLYDPTLSQAWRNNNVVANGTFTLNLLNNLGYFDHGKYGYDTVTLGWQGSDGPSLDSQIVAGIETKDFFLGFFGLTPRPTNFSTFNNPTPSYVQNLKETDRIPSLSWAYTAGNQYRPGNVLGSLILGGYDAGKVSPSGASFEMNAVDQRDLTVDIESIIFDSGSSGTAKNDSKIDSIAAFIDSTVAELWLPENVCSEFEAAFHLTWNDTIQGYLVNDTLHKTLQAENTSVTLSFTAPVSAETDNPKSVVISLPYVAFDLTASYPLLTNKSGYFPLQRAANASQYTLGRVFLQEAYIIANYERRNFSVSQARWPAGNEEIVAIRSPTPGKSGALSRGIIAGIVIGAVVGLTLLTALAAVLRKRSRRPLGSKTTAQAKELDGESTKLSHSQNNKNSGVEEMEGEGFRGHEVDSKKLPGYEADAGPYGQELGDSQLRFELDAGEDVKHEMPVREVAATELSQPASEM